MLKLLPYLIFAGGVLAFVIGVYFYGHKNGYDLCELKILEQTANDQEVLNEIRNNRTDIAGVVKRLRKGTF